MIYDGHFVCICSANPSDSLFIALIISAGASGIALLSRDSSFRSTHFTIYDLLQIFQDKTVRLVHHACVE